MSDKVPVSPPETPPVSINGRVAFRSPPPRRRKNRDLRPREHLTEAEINRLIEVAKRHNRWGHRDSTAVLVAFAHGLRAVELCNLEWGQIDFRQGSILIHRAKNGIPSTHYLSGRELRALRELQRQNERRFGPGRYIFLSERGGGPVTTAWFRKMFAELGVMAKMPWPIHPHIATRQARNTPIWERTPDHSPDSLGIGICKVRRSIVLWLPIGFGAGKKSNNHRSGGVRDEA
jgi:integrase